MVLRASTPEATTAGLTVVSCDPLYRFTAADIRCRIAETTQVIIEQTQRNHEKFVWTSIHSVEELRQLRSSAMERFLADFERGSFAYTLRVLIAFQRPPGSG
jgi:hypothetical protein